MKNYEMMTVKAYFGNYELAYNTVSENEVEAQVEKYILAARRNETNARTVEALVA